MAKDNNSVKEVNPLLFRYPPNTRFINGSFKNQIEQPVIKEDFGESITDKESYRLSLASKRGALASGSIQSGWYMFEDGKYDPNKDYSYIIRQDLSIVDIDRYIESLTNKLNNSDESLRKEIQEQIQAAQQYKQNKENEHPDTINKDSAE